MMAFLSSHIAELAFSGAVGVLTALYARLAKEVKLQKSLNSGVVSILHSLIFSEATAILSRGEITLGEMDNLSRLYTSYHDAGGNGSGTKLYQDCMDLPVAK